MTDTPKNQPRLYVNLFGAPLLLGAMYYGDVFFTILFAGVSFLSVYEFNNICKKMDYPQLVAIPYSILTLLTLSALNIYHTNLYQIFLFSIISGMILTVISDIKEPITAISTSIFSTVWIGLFFYSIVNIRLITEIGLALTVVMFVSVWICDSAAYIFGKKFGDKKIAPTISPKKTWVGSISGFVCTLLFVLGFYYYNWLGYNLSLPITILLGFVFGGISQFGDLFESKFKRIAKIKDSSQFLQGHGGFLDRFDSLLITAPATLFILNF